MILKRFSLPARAEGILIKVLIFSYLSGSLFLFCHSIETVMAQTPATAKVVFVSKRDGNAEIYVMNPDGSAQLNLTRHHAKDYDPAWSPDGTQIVFSSDRGGGLFDLYLMNADGTNVRKVFKSKAYRRRPTWSPDGKSIAYESGKPLGLHPPHVAKSIYFATPDGNAEEKITDGFDPRWSPDGREIVFAGVGPEDTALGIFNLQTRDQETLLSEEIPWVGAPTWAPQGDKIAFAQLHGAAFNAEGFLFYRESTLHLVNSDGTGLQQLSREEEKGPYHPTWSPDGTELIYSARLDKPGLPAQLFKTDMKGGISTQLTHDGDNIWPDWFNPTARSVSPSVHSLTTTWGKIKED